MKWGHSQLEVEHDSWTALSNNLQTEQENNKGKIRSLCKNFGSMPIFRELFRQQRNEDKSKN